MHSQTGVWEQGRSPVGRVDLIPTYGFLSLLARFYFMPILINGAMAIAPYGFLLNQKALGVTNA